VGIAVVVAASVGGFFALRSRGDQPIAATSAQPSSPPAATSAPEKSTAGLAVARPQEPEERTVHVAILPHDARVEVDGHPAVNRVCDERELSCVPGVAITGPLGSLHHVKVIGPMGKRETSGDIVIAESGAVPSKIELGVAPPPPPTGATVANNAGGNTPPATTQAPPPPPPATKVTPPPAVTIDRTF
jgi:hypothetical protein